MGSPTVRELTLDEIPLVSWSGSATHLEYVRDAVERASAGEIDFLTAWVEGSPVAIGGADYALDPTVGKLWMLTVHPDFQSRGLGTLLVMALEDRCRSRGCTAITMSVDKNNTRARALYERLGYRVVGTTIESWNEESDDGIVTPNAVDCHVMSKAI